MFIIASLDSILLPNTFQEALSHPGWRSAMLEEMDALNENGTWNLIHLPTGKKAIGCRWVFAAKVNLDGSIARLKSTTCGQRVRSDLWCGLF